MRSIPLIPAFIATLVLGLLAGCSKLSLGTGKAAAPPASATAKADASAPMKAQPTPNPDERLALTLEHLGAKKGSRGETLTLGNDDFTSNHSKLQAPTADQLKQIVTALKDYPHADVIVIGYTDNRGGQQRDERISLKQADVVKQALVTDGMDASRIRAQGLGQADPIGDNATKAGREENRRVELVFSTAEGKLAATKDQSSKTG
ncbi:MAG: OmpA family protein [Proteobacteria bacterium]|nr:OmpA family protein [Pseudomonadota bacterium]